MTPYGVFSGEGRGKKGGDGGQRRLELRGFLNGGLPQLGRVDNLTTDDLAAVKRLSSLHKRLALTEMTKHEFLDDKFRQERTTFSDGTTVTVDWDANKVTISPDF